MRLAFDEAKATQAAAMLLALAGCKLNYMALIKLLYRADREALRKLGLPITTDRYASMRHGPVTSIIYDRIKASASSVPRPTFWANHIRRAEPNTVVLVSDPGRSELSPAEERIIEEVYAEHGEKDRFALVDECHRDFPEWKDPGRSSFPLEISAIIAALELSEEEAAHVEALINLQQSAATLTT